MDSIQLSNANGISITLSPFGASWLSCILPLKTPREILLGCAPELLPQQSAYIGATVGRYANRIANARYTDHQKTYYLSANQSGTHTLHGGADNFAYRQWDIVSASDTKVVFSLSSADGDQGFAGNFHVTLSYALTDNSVIITYDAQCDTPSICSLTNHAYFNLNGILADSDVRTQWLCIESDHYMPVDSSGLPMQALGNSSSVLKPVVGTAFDFTQEKQIHKDFEQVLQPVGGYDHSWYLGHNEKEKLACQLRAADQAISMKVYTTQPALHVYSGNFLADQQPLLDYENYSGIAIETGCLPNSPNIQRYQTDCFIGPNNPYQHRTTYTFDW